MLQGSNYSAVQDLCAVFSLKYVHLPYVQLQIHNPFRYLFSLFPISFLHLSYPSIFYNLLLPAHFNLISSSPLSSLIVNAA